MKKILTIGILMGMIAITGEKTMASVGTAYTGYMMEQSDTDKNEKNPRQIIHEASGLEKALKNHR